MTENAATYKAAPDLALREREEGARLVGAMTPGEWWNESRIIHAPLGNQSAWHPVMTSTDEDADAICWLRNHAAQLLTDSSALARERQRVAELRAALVTVRQWSKSWAGLSGSPAALLSLQQFVDEALAADAPEQRGEGEQQ